MDLNTPITKIPRVGLNYQKKLKKMGIATIRDLLWHFPFRYDDFSNLTNIADAKIGQNVCVEGKIINIEIQRTWKRKMFLTNALIQDQTGSIGVVWFNQPFLINILQKGDMVILAGKISQGPNGLYLSSPIHEKISKNKIQKSNLIHTARLVPVYPETEGLSSRWLRFILKPILTALENKIIDPLPENIKKKYELLNLKDGLKQIHFPDSKKLAKKAQERFCFEELFILSLIILKERLALNLEKAITIPINIKAVQNFVKSLPYQLTNAQKKSAWRILKDLEKHRPMNRLLEGDVGSGKTIVAIMAALNVVLADFQVAFMAPTEILAHQHFGQITQLLKIFKLKKVLLFKIGLLTSQEVRINSKKFKREELLNKLKRGEIDILIGTHALIQKEVKFKNLALVILDEQHRFGVKQRTKLCTQSELVPHLLSMTATPIPRTLALTIYGDLDLSLIDEMPKNRKKIITRIINPLGRKSAYKFIEKEVNSGRQAFVICPRIEPSLNKGEQKNNIWTDVKAVKEEYVKLSEKVFPSLKIAMLHGKMKSQEKEKIMKKFKEKKIDILISTSVIEVGIDVPNATVMMIEGADKFGLAQLHQFRGRIGRGQHQSYCFLFTESSGRTINRRLKALISCQNGFELAEKDLEIRGPGDLSGFRQSGIPDLLMASLKNLDLVEKTRDAAKDLLLKDPSLKKYPLLQKEVRDLKQTIHLE